MLSTLGSVTVTAPTPTLSPTSKLKLEEDRSSDQKLIFRNAGDAGVTLSFFFPTVLELRISRLVQPVDAAKTLERAKEIAREFGLPDEKVAPMRSAEDISAKGIWLWANETWNPLTEEELETLP